MAHLDEVSGLGVDPLERVAGRRLRHPADGADVPDVVTPALVEGSILHGDRPVLTALDGDLPGAEPVETSSDLAVVEPLRTWLEREHRVLDEGAVGLLGKDVEERGGVVLGCVEVHERDDVRVEHWSLGSHFPPAEVLAQGVSDSTALPSGGRLTLWNTTGARSSPSGSSTTPA